MFLYKIKEMENVKNETKKSRKGKSSSIKNCWGPLSLIIAVPVLLFSVLIKTNLISKNFLSI